jgi:hypothetical protein
MRRRFGPQPFHLVGPGALLAFALVVTGCQSADPQKELAISDVETYWVMDAPAGATQYMAPAVRFRVRNKGSRAWDGIQATATFRRKGEESKSWGSDWKRVTPIGKSLAPGESVLVVLRSDGRYYSAGSAESMFHHGLFRDATVDVFLRIGGSTWTKVLARDVDRHVGTRELGPGTPSPTP